ncbi:pilus assembly PilX family protein [Marinobacterium iners]|uniref:Type IV pilus assembly protein PilX n=1 Tax=Marinobacterium iners DSM 11526 TaxID=1122198 RepID=A0A1H4BUU5_9GAMM|nr:PilX N-terminal domain-containing pilus assembly protein [Marinobacterium iners]SEA51602.1 type IV pilus assembly protein PilX [Marinobacterium iners DSM 11526]
MREIKPTQRMRGATLVVAMIMLILIAIIGFGAMQTTTMEEKMSGNLRDKNMAFQAAEAGLREREDWLRGLTSPPSPNGQWLFDDEISWNAPLEYGSAGVIDIAGVSADPMMAVEEMEFLPDELVVGFERRKGRDIYRIMARGTGQSPNAITVLESTSAKRFD